MLHQERVFATVNLDNIHYNIRHVRESIPKKTKIMAVIKADGYGHPIKLMNKPLVSSVTRKKPMACS